MVVINLEPYPSPRPRFSKRGTYMPSEYTAWKKQFLKEWLKHNLSKYETGVAIAIDLKFYIKPPKAIARVKKNQNILKSETWRVVNKQTWIILKSQCLILLMVMRMKTTIRSVICIHLKGIH